MRDRKRKRNLSHKQTNKQTSKESFTKNKTETSTHLYYNKYKINFQNKKKIMSESVLTSSFLDLINEIEDKLLETNEISGTDTNDKIYSDLKTMWEYELQIKKEKKKKEKKEKNKKNNEVFVWYSNAFDYWENEENCPISDDGVLGGFGFLTEVDVRDSNQFLDSILLLKSNLLENVAGRNNYSLFFCDILVLIVILFLFLLFFSRLWCRNWSC